ncbi:hypothetical protein SAMD00019534_052820 [Acytostelium subglobosum LB1]|uniref:hypothetical protein n=1 Tax=Acytostelium subglobosum LB1 TaxID=1410327 RepID=UPI000644DCA9|nr:hypothetical protein SAMD00019534_052820 [Acytostelium subglobosum LB1]GAM22107.1 hypothetical protein SAMD00019534_052820 [Acytostelium subglobosum LB1]|eukprot:XP_012755207.1 hypothetical protein SAMD00019534_052820 [Acytostelium subglobosum LB1]
MCVSSHKRHDVENVQHLRSLINEGQYDDTSKLRLKLLWSMLQRLSVAHHTMTESCKNVSDQFKQLHDMLVIEEHRITSPLNDKIQQTSSTIHDIINEIKNINSLFSQSTTKTDDLEINEIIQSIKSSTSPKEFIDKTFPTTTTTTTSTSTEVTDIELLTMIKNHVNQMNTTIHVLTRPYKVVIDQDMIDSVKDEIRSLTKLMEPIEHFTHDLDGQIMCIENENVSLFSPATNGWTDVDGDSFEKANYFCSSVYARGHVYVFGPRDDCPSTYSRFSLVTRKWQYDIPMAGVRGGRLCSVCFDGDKYIYLVGGTTIDVWPQVNFNRVDCFNIETQEFSIDSITISIIEFNLASKKSTFIKGIIPETALSVVFDGNDRIYIFLMHRFISMSLLAVDKAKTIRELTPPPANPLYGEEKWARNTLVYYTPEQGTILNLQGTGNNYRYSIKLDEWTKINDNDPIEDRGYSALSLLYDNPVKRTPK